MLTVNPIRQNNVQKNEVHFTSDLVPTKYLKEGFKTAIEEKYISGKFLSAVKGILNDGKKDSIKIDEHPGSIMSACQAKRQDIFVNGVKVKNKDYHFGLIYDGNQCAEGIVKFARENKLYSKPGELEIKIAELNKELKKATAKYNRQARAELRTIKKQLFG